MSSFSIIVCNDTVNGCGWSVRLSKSKVLRDRLLSSAAAVTNCGLNSSIMAFSKVLQGLSINNTLFNAHFVQLFEVAFRVLGLALFVHFPRRGHNASVFVVSAISLTIGETLRGEIASSGLGSSDIVLHEQLIFLVYDLLHSDFFLLYLF